MNLLSFRKNIAALTAATLSFSTFSPLLADSHKSNHQPISAGARIINNSKLAHSKADFSPPEWVLENNLMYEMNILRTPSMKEGIPDGTFKAAATNLKRLRDLGVTIIWLMPIFDVGDGSVAINAKANVPSHYAPTDFFTVRSGTGTIKDVKEFVRKAHKLGIHVILDITANQTGYSNPLLQSHPEWFERNTRGEAVNGAADAVGAFFWDISNFKAQDAPKELEDYIIKVLTFWIKKTDIDGFRFDGGTGAWKDKFWVNARKACEAIKPCFFFGEDTYPGQGVIQSRVFNGAYGFRVAGALLNPARTVEGVMQAILWDEVNTNTGLVRTNYSANHDPVFSQTPAEIYGSFYTNELVLRYTMPNYMPKIVQGEDGGNLGRINLFDDTIISNDFHSDTTKLLKKLNKLRKCNVALHNVARKDGQYSFYLTELDGSLNDQEILAFVRWNDSNNRVLVLVNFSDEDKEYSTGQIFEKSMWLANNTARDVLPDGKYCNFFFDETQPESPLNDRSVEVTISSWFGAPSFTTTVGANSFKVYVSNTEYSFPPVDIEQQSLYKRWNYMAVYPDLPSLFEVAKLPQENIAGFSAALQANKSYIKQLLKNNTAVTFFAPQGDTLPPGFTLDDFIVPGLKTYDPASTFEFFDNPADALGVPKSFDVFETGVPINALSGNTITLLTPPPAFYLPYVPTYNINGTEYQIVSNNITFVYKDADGVTRQGLLNTIEPVAPVATAGKATRQDKGWDRETVINQLASKREGIAEQIPQ